MEGTTENDVKGRSIDDEHAKACTCEDTEEVVVVSDDRFTEGIRELGLDCKDLQKKRYYKVDSHFDLDYTYVEALNDEDRQVH